MRNAVKRTGESNSKPKKDGIRRYSYRHSKYGDCEDRNQHVNGKRLDMAILEIIIDLFHNPKSIEQAIKKVYPASVRDLAKKNEKYFDSEGKNYKNR